MTLVTKPATEVRVGDSVVERDGAYFKVTAVRVRGRLVEYSLKDESGCCIVAPKMATVSSSSMVNVMVEEAEHFNEPFCACGRRISECDGSRKGCKKGGQR